MKNAEKFKNDYLVAKISVDTAENELFQVVGKSDVFAGVHEGQVEEGARRGLSFVSLSDTHGAQPAVPEADVLLREPRVEKFDGPAIEPIELLNIRIRVEILSEFRKFYQNSSEIQKFEDLSTFSKLFIEILRNSH